MNKGLNAVLIVAIIIYTFAPVDLAPGLIDDVLLWIIYGIAQGKIRSHEAE